MKRLVRDTSKDIHLSDILKRIIHVELYADIDEAHYSVINSSEDVEDDWEDMSDDQYYLTLPDSNLMELTVDEVHKVENIELLTRLANLRPGDISLNQRKLLKKAYGYKIKIDRRDVKKVIDLLKQCNSIAYNYLHPKTNAFALSKEGELREQECLDILHQLTVEDYVTSSKSYNIGHVGNDIILFEPDVDWTDNEGNNIGQILIYVKLDLDETTGNAVALVSIHKAEHEDDHPYAQHHARKQ